MKSTKIITGPVQDLRQGDTLIATSPNGAWKSVQPEAEFLGRYRTTVTREMLALLEDGREVEKSYRAGTVYRVRRTLTVGEMEENRREAIVRGAQEIRDAIADPMRGLRAARDKVIEDLTTMYRDDPAGALHHAAQPVAVAQALADRWVHVSRVVDYLHRSAEADAEEPRSDETVLRALLTTVAETEVELLRGDYARSTNPYANAMEDDRRRGFAEWLRAYPVLHGKSAAKLAGIVVDDDE